MTDIVERLRDGARMLAQYHLEEDVLEAAVEIERLRKELAEERAKPKAGPVRHVERQPLIITGYDYE